MSAHGTAGPRQRVIIAGGGFAGFHAARRLGRLAKNSLDVVVVNPTDYFLYLPLLPEAAAGILDPRTVADSRGRPWLREFARLRASLASQRRSEIEPAPAL